MVNFKEVSHEIFNYEFHKPILGGSYIRENGIYQFEAVTDLGLIAVTLETGLTLINNSIDWASPDYEVSSVSINGEIVDLYDLADIVGSDIYEKIQNLPKQTTYSDNFEDYLFTIQSDDETLEEIKNLTYEEVLKKFEKPPYYSGGDDYIVIDVYPLHKPK